MDNDRVRPEWALCMDRGDVAGLRAMVTASGFDFQQGASLRSLGFPDMLPHHHDIRLTPLGYSLWTKNVDAFRLLLEAGSNPDAIHVVWHKGGGGNRPIEVCATIVQPSVYLEILLHYGASTHFVKRSTGRPFVEYCHDYSNIIRAAHDRELCAYTAVWCALNAGGCWPDMAMLLQAMVMRDT